MLLNQKIVDHQKICPSCDYDLNPLNSTQCTICGTKLVEKNQVHNYKKKQTKKRKADIFSGFISNNAVQLYFQDKTANWLNFRRKNPLPLNSEMEVKELKKPVNILGLGIIVMGLALWGNYLLQKPTEVNSNSTDEKKQIAIQKLVAPKGLYSYGGASFFAPLVRSGLNVAVESAYPNFDLRYTKPLNQDFSYANGINMLIEGELSFAFNGRPLTDAEYEKAKLRNISLKQVPIFIDGVVLFGNHNTSVSKLNRDQVEQIFQGKITNWKQIDAKSQDLPIVPVLINMENSKMLAINEENIAKSTQYAPNYTQALRKVIGTPGAISFASASLVENQKLIKMFALAEGNTKNYIPPSIDDLPNLKAFKDGSYPLTRRLYLTYREDDTRDNLAAKAYLDFLIEEKGQEIGKKAGFVPIY